MPGCDCGSAPCGDVECLPGELAPGALGRWTSIAADSSRVLVATYDHVLGDLVVVDVTDPDAPARLVVDGVPADVTPTYDPSTYRGGIEGAGPDVGAWTSIAIAGGNAMVAYQDREAGALKLAYEHSAGKWSSHVVDNTPGAEVGRYASVAIDGDGRPAIAYVALGLDPGDGTRTTELRLARASTASPDSSSRWTTSVIASGRGTCAGLCGSGEACIAVMDGQACTAVTSDCAASCASDEACVAGACTEKIQATVADIGTGTGLFVSLVALLDGRLAAAYYDRNARSLVLAVEDGVGASTFTETVLHEGPGDRGLWASAVVDASGVVHVAYQDAIGDQLLYTTVDLSLGVAPGTPEVVDDGQRDGDRPHPVGAAAAIFLHGGAPAIAYQDGMTADVYLATTPGAWSHSAIASGPLLDGFSIGATTGRGDLYLAWHRLDPAQEPASTLHVQRR